MYPPFPPAALGAAADHLPVVLQKAALSLFSRRLQAATSEFFSELQGGTWIRLSFEAGEGATEAEGKEEQGMPGSLPPQLPPYFVKCLPLAVLTNGFIAACNSIR